MAPQFDQLNDLFLHELQDLYDAEHQLLDALPEMAKAANDPDLEAAFREHLEETEGQVRRLESIFSSIEQKPKRDTCKAMQGLVKEGKESIKADGDPVVNDLALIGAAQRVEHYEMAGYGAARTLARMCGKENAAEQLQATLNEEGSADKKLTSLAKKLYSFAA